MSRHMIVARHHCLCSEQHELNGSALSCLGFTFHSTVTMTKPRGCTVEQRDRAFGGKAGIWLKKRKQGAVHPANDKATHGKKMTPQTVDGNDALVTSKEKTEENLPAKPNHAKRNVVGWDDLKCRPIYENSSTASTTSSTSVDESDDDETVDPILESRDDVSGKNKRTVGDESAVESSLVVTSSSDNTESRKTRAYGSRKRKSNLSSSRHNTCKLKRQHVSKKNKETVPVDVVMTPSMNSMTFDPITPQTGLGNNICAALNSVTKEALLDSLVSDVNSKDTKPEKERKEILIKGRKKTKQPTMPLLAELDFVDDDNVSQPSSTTSLSAAKAFFERLDAQQKLTLDASESPVLQGKKCVRTRRAVHIQSDSLRQEYEEYVSATKATGVEPLSVEEYAVNRSAFFRTGDMYDGFLDG